MLGRDQEELREEQVKERSSLKNVPPQMDQWPPVAVFGPRREWAKNGGGESHNPCEV
jgi:hypothetical protein